MQAREKFNGAPLTLDAVTFILTLSTFFTVLYSRAAADRFKEMYDKVRRFSRWCLHARARAHTHTRADTHTHARADTHTHTQHTHKACGVSEAVQEISIWVTSYFPGPANTRVCVCVGLGGCVCLCAAFG